MHKTIIDGIGNSMRYWANYICAVKRQKIINEGSIKYGISEYLISSENLLSGTSPTGKPQIINVEFEKTNEIFIKRRTDLYIEVSEGSQKIGAYFEFKHLKTPSNRQEINRYIDDFLRLASLVKQNPQCECYFMIVGIPKLVNSFLGDSTSRNESSSEQGRLQISHIPPKSDYSDIKKCISLSRCKKGMKSILLKELVYEENGTFKSHHKRFKNEYKYRDFITDDKKITDADTIHFELKFTSQPDTNDMIGVYIWQIKIN